MNLISMLLVCHIDTAELLSNGRNISIFGFITLLFYFVCNESSFTGGFLI